MTASWEDRVAGRVCPFDYPRPDIDEFLLVRKLSVSSLYLQRHQTYRGHSVLIYDTAHVLRIDQLSTHEWVELARDLHTAEAAVVSAVQPDHVNVASLGNIVPHLHWHIVPRYKADPNWGGPDLDAEHARHAIGRGRLPGACTQDRGSMSRSMRVDCDCCSTERRHGTAAQPRHTRRERP